MAGLVPALSRRFALRCPDRQEMAGTRPAMTLERPAVTLERRAVTLERQAVTWVCAGHLLGRLE